MPDSPKQNTLQIALMGAGGKMGYRITDNIKDSDRYRVDYVEVSDEGRSRLAERDVSTTPQDEALSGADVVILALPDKFVGTITQEIVPQLKAGRW